MWSFLDDPQKETSEDAALSIGPFQKVQREVIYPLCSDKKWKAAINPPKIVAYTVKIVEFMGGKISEHL